VTINTKFILLCAASLLLTGCASTAIFPKGGNNYSSVTTSASQGNAEEDAKKKSERECVKQGKHLAIVSHQTTYRGADTGSKIAGGILGGLLLGGYNPAISSDDYEVKMQFRCA